MTSLTIHNVTAAVHEALRAQAAAHGRSVEAEAREILERAVQANEHPVRMGDALAALGRIAELTDEDIEVLESLRDRRVAEPLRLE